MSILNRNSFLILVLVLDTISLSNALAAPRSESCRRQVLGWLGTATAGAWSRAGWAVPADSQEGASGNFDVDDFLRTGVVSQPMGVSGQAGKSRPETGVVLRDGSEVSRDPRSGDVLAEIVVKDESNEPNAVLASFSSPWPLATGTVFDVECRDSKTGDGVFLSVTGKVGGKSLEELKDSFFVDQLVAPTGRFSFYGTPTDVKITKSRVDGHYRIMDMSFSTLSQSTQTEIPRKARIAATIPSGSSQAVMLVASASTLRWKKGTEKTVDETIASFRAIPAPRSSLKLRGKDRKS